MKTVLVGFGKIADTLRHDSRMARYFPDASHAQVLARHHGPEYWKKVVSIDAQAWLDIAAGAKHPKEDLYGGKLKELTVPSIFLHGSRDPRTEPDELAAVERELPGRLRVIEGATHCPHSESGAAAESTRIALEFIDGVMAKEPKD